jgi:hypothetical protein
MSNPRSIGICSLCAEKVSRTSMTRHLNGCTQPGDSGTLSPGPSFHLLVEGRHAKAYWMHAAVPIDAPFSKLDHFLRRTWLECCGHLSGFAIQGEKTGMTAPLCRRIDVGMKFTYEYDYGSTTELVVKVVAVRDQGTPKGAVQLLARNEPPPIICSHCEQPATQVCGQCACDDMGWLCESCADTHSCGDEMLLPVTNSPRVGVCAYSG